MRRALRALALGLSVLLLATACGDGGDEPVAGAAGTENPGGVSDPKGTIGFSVYDMQYEFFQTMEEGTREAVEEAGYEYILHDQKGDESEMVSGALALIDQGIDALIISPFKPDALGPIVARAKEAGIPVVVDDIGGGGTDYDAIVISDNFEGGVLAAEYLDEQLSARDAAKKVASIQCQADAVYAARRNEGFRQRIEELGYDVVAELSADSQAEKAYTVMQDILSANPDVAGVFSCNDPMAVAAANAIEDAGSDPIEDITVVGFNADPEAIEAINADRLAGTIAQFPREMGHLSVELAVKVISGEEIQFDNPEDREVFAPVELVTAENVDTFQEQE